MPIFRRTKTYSLCFAIDSTDRLYVEVVLWVVCAKTHLPNYDLAAYLIGDIPADLVDWLKRSGIRILRASSPVKESPHCNKILPFGTQHGTDYTIVTDTDVYFVADPSPYLLSDRYRAAPNNHCNPPGNVFERVLQASGLGRPYRPGLSLFGQWDGRRETHINNISGGIVIAPRKKSARLAQAWTRWASWLIDNRGLMGPRDLHIDQVAFALAMEDIGEDVEFLPPQCNMILEALPVMSTPIAFHLTTAHVPHFAERFNADRTIAADGLDASMTRGIERLNRCILEAVEIIRDLPSTRDHYDKFLNPAWRR